MRKRWNITWKQEMFELPKACSNCWKPIDIWEVCTFDLDSRYIIAECCSENNNWPEKGNYIIIESYEPTQFSYFPSEKHIEEYEKRMWY